MKRIKRVYVPTIFMVLSLLLLGGADYAQAWTMVADFESGSIGARAQGQSGFTFAGTQTTYSSEKVFSGSKSAKIVWSPGSDGYAISHGEFTHPAKINNGGEIWMRGYYYFASPWSWDGTFNKVLRIHVLNSSGKNVGYHSIITNGSGALLASNETASIMDNTGFVIDKDRWQALEVYVKFSNSDPIFRIWKDGQLVYESKTEVMMWNTSDYIWRTLIMTHWNGGAPRSQVQYVDDCVVTTDRPSQVDAYGNPMIGLANGAAPPVASPPPEPTPAPTPDPTPAVSSIEWAAQTYTVNEGVGTASFTLSRTGETSGAASVNWGTFQSSATLNSDYSGVAWTNVSFAPGETSKQVSVPIIDDSLVESNETFTISLANPSGADLGSKVNSTVTISDNDTNVILSPPQNLTVSQ